MEVIGVVPTIVVAVINTYITRFDLKYEWFLLDLVILQLSVPVIRDLKLSFSNTLLLVGSVSGPNQLTLGVGLLAASSRSRA